MDFSLATPRSLVPRILSATPTSVSNMSSITDVFAGLDAAVAAVGELDLVALPLAELVEVLDRLETARRRATAFAYDAAAAVDR
jgi:hypothetical protein